jgi:hypothetical protein
MEKVLVSFFTEVARYQEEGLQSPLKEELHEVFQNVGLSTPTPLLCVTRKTN